MELKLRQEEEKDYRTVEELTREAFWNVHSPGCDEHLLVHQLRAKNEFVKALDFVAVYDDKIVGNIIYTETKIIENEDEFNVLTFGPVSVLPEYQNKGIGSQLIIYTGQLALEMGYKAILIYGDPEFYKRFGFKESKNYKITNKDKKYPAALLVWELYPNALNGIEGIFDDGDIYGIDQKELIDFEKGFEKKEKKVTKTQERFLEMVNKFL